MSVLDGFNLSGKTALVTGASRGIGRAIALGLGECGAAVAVHYVGRADAADEVAAQLQRACVVQGDLGDGEAPRRIVEEAEARLGPIDILVLNASVQFRRPWQDIPRDEFDQQVAVNLRSEMEMIQLAVPRMMERGWGRVVTVGSVQELKPHPQMLIYAATKAALLSMVRNLAPQLAPRGVTINNLSPGVIETDRNAEVLNSPKRADVQARIPVGFIGQSDDCAGAALLLCSDAGRYITGTTLLVDGGWSL